METDTHCPHQQDTRTAHAGISVNVCVDCPHVTFSDPHGFVDPSVALGRLFGEFDLIGSLAAVGAPGHEVLMYQAPDRLANAALRVITPNRWFRADEELWICHDTDHLLFSHDHPAASHLVGA